MKKLITLLTLLVVAVTGAWADDPTWSINTSSAASSQWVGPYQNGAIVVSFNGSDSNTKWEDAGDYVLGNGSGTNAAKNFLQITTTSEIEKVSFLISSNSGDEKNTQPALLAWGGSIEGNPLAAFVNNAVSLKGAYSNAVWMDYDLSAGSYKNIRLVRKASAKVGDATSTKDYGNGQSCRVWGVKIWLKAQGPVNPSFSLTKTSIGTDETSQIKVEGKDNLDGITLSDITYGTSGVVTVNATTGVVTPVAVGTTMISFNSSAVAGKYNAGSGNLSITVTAPQVATPTLPATGTFVESKSVEISCATDGATIKYSYDNTNWTDYTTALNITETKTVYAKATKSGYTDSEVASATYTKVTPHTWAAISESTTWDWSTLTTTEVKLTDSTTPTKTEEFLLGDMNGEIYTYNIGYDPATFNADALKVVTEYAVREKKYMQGNKIKFNTTVPGYVRVTYSNTGGDRPYRYVKVNDTFSQEGSASATAKTTEYIPVPAGEVTVVGYIQDANDPKPRSGDVVGEAMLRISKVEFLKQASTVVTSAGWATATTPDYGVEFDENTNVYVVTDVSNSISLAKITEAPANTAVIVNAPAGSYTMTPKADAAAPAKNLLLSSDGSVVGTTTGSPYVLGKNLSNVVGFGPLANGVTLAKGKAYIDGSEFVDAKDFYPFVIGDEENETTSINSIENGESRIENSDYIYNLAGQKVSKDYKGIVIVNGKKVIRK